MTQLQLRFKVCDNLFLSAILKWARFIDLSEVFWHFGVYEWFNNGVSG